MPQLTFVSIQSLCTVVVVYTYVMCMFVHWGSGITLLVHCIHCTLYATFWLVYMWHKSIHPGAPHSMYVRFWSLHSCTRCFKVFWSSCWPSTSYFVGHVSHEYIKWDWVQWTQLLGCCTTVVLCICIEVELTISAKCPYLLALDVFATIGVDTIQITSSAYFSVCWWCGCTVLLFLFISDLQLIPNISNSKGIAK